MRKKVKRWKCLADWTCCYKCGEGKSATCTAPDSRRRACKKPDGTKLYEGET